MKEYYKYSFTDFVIDDYFIHSCLSPSKESDIYWSNFTKANPDKKADLLEAKKMIFSLNQIENEQIPLEYNQHIWNNIESNITSSNQAKRNFKYFLPSTVAFLSCLLVFNIITIYINSSASAIPIAQKLAWVNVENNTGAAKTIELSDHSKVILEPFSTLKYPKIFEENQRLVLLKGEAFFDVEKDSLRPFMVFANETITKVLGTSFRITAFEGAKTVEVDVKTGKVAVYAKVGNETTKTANAKIKVETDEKIYVPKPNKKLEVTPNQKVVFNKNEQKMEKKLTRLPFAIKEIKSLPKYKFKNEPIIEVFETLEMAYGIDLIFNKELLSKCTITTTLTDESLFDKLNIICMALNLKFTEKDATIIIKGNGC